MANKRILLLPSSHVVFIPFFISVCCGCYQKKINDLPSLSPLFGVRLIKKVEQYLPGVDYSPPCFFLSFLAWAAVILQPWRYDACMYGRDKFRFRSG